MKTYPVFHALACAFLTIVSVANAQTPVNTVSTTNTIVVPGGTLTSAIKSHPNAVNTILPNTNYTVKYNNTGNININSFTLSTKTYVKFKGFDTVIVRRVANAWETTGGNKQHIYVEGATTVDNVTRNMPFPAAFPQVSNYDYMARVMEDGYINRGSDNVFNNDSTSDLTYNNIERVDFVYKTGVATTGLTTAGFLITERGGNDDFKIAAVTGIDANGNPTAFGRVVSVPASKFGAAICNITTYVMRKDAADNALRPFSLVPLQSVKSVFITFADLGIASMQTIYGYALMGDDVTATTSAQLLAYTNSTYFPRTTTTSDGGMDLAAAPGIFHTDLILDNESISLTTQSSNCRQVLQWKDDNAALVSTYELQYSSTNTQFRTIQSVQASSQQTTYNYTDAVNPMGYYRIKATMYGGKEVYSAIVAARNACSTERITLFPNPSKDVVTINYDATMQIREVSILSVAGLRSGTWKIDASTNQVRLDISALSKGQYYVETVDVTGARKAYPIVKM